MLCYNDIGEPCELPLGNLYKVVEKGVWGVCVYVLVKYRIFL